MKYITVKLTEDQARAIMRWIQYGEREMQQQSQQEHAAYLRRIYNKLDTRLLMSKHEQY